MKYQKPKAEQLTFTFQDQVVAASSNSCYTANAWIHQTPQTGRGDYRIQVNGQHKADHTKESQVLTISFNQPVVYKSCNGIYTVDNSVTIRIATLYISY